MYFASERRAGMAELADAHGSGPCGSNTMRVQVPFPAFSSIIRTLSWLERCSDLCYLGNCLC